MKQLLGAMSIFTLVMTVPQILTIWVGRQAAGVSLLSWSAYFVSALIWFWYGVQKRDRNIYLPCSARRRVVHGPSPDAIGESLSRPPRPPLQLLRHSRSSGLVTARFPVDRKFFSPKIA